MSKVIDVREGGGEVVILGRALVLPGSTTDGPTQPLDGSIRFNPTGNAVEVYVAGGWAALGGEGGSGGPHTHPISNIVGLQAALDSKAAAGHSQAISTVTGLQTALDGKAALSHTHPTDSIEGLDGELASLTSAVSALQSGKANTSHNHTLVSINGLQAALDAKAPAQHQHSTSEIGDLANKITVFTRETFRSYTAGTLSTGLVHRFMVTGKTVIPQNMVGSRGKVTGTPGATRILDVMQNGSLVGAISIDGAGFFSFSTVSPLGIILLAGDDLSIVATATDAAVSQISIALLGEMQVN